MAAKVGKVHKAVLTGIAILVVGCGTTVTPIGLHDQMVPIEERRLVADAQDAVSIARARVNDAELRYNEAIEWQEKVSELSWPQDNGARMSFVKLAEARTELARLILERYQAELGLAESKLVLMSAEASVRNDIAIYELEPLRAEVESKRQSLEERSGVVIKQQQQLDSLTREWWTAFQSYAQAGGDTVPYYTDFIKVELPPPPPVEPQESSEPVSETSEQ